MTHYVGDTGQIAWANGVDGSVVAMGADISALGVAVATKADAAAMTASLGSKLSTVSASATYAPHADTFALRRIVALASSDASASALRLRRDRDDAYQFLEAWPNLTNWAPTANNQVASGKVYGLGTVQNPGGAARWFAAPKFSRFRYTGTINFVAGGTDYVMLGLSAAAPPLGSGGALSTFWGLQGSIPNRYNNGGMSGATNTPMTAVGGSAVITATTSYTISIQGDELGISVSLMDLAHTVEWTDYVPWTSVVADFITATFWVSDTRQTSGSSLGALGASTSINTVAPRTGIEGVGGWIASAVDSGAQNMRVSLPASYDSRTPTPVVIYHHGTGEFASAPFTDTLKRAMIQTLLTNGFIVASTDGAGDNWGNAAGLTAYQRLYQYLRDHFAIGPIHHLGQSMGGMSATMTLAGRSVPAASVALIYPCTNLAAMYGTSLSTQIDTAYGIPGTGTYAVQTAGHDPNLMPGSAFRGIPVWGIASPTDNVADKALNLDAFIASVTPYAAEVTTLVSSGLHGDPTNFDATAQASLLAFLKRHSTATGA